MAEEIKAIYKCTEVELYSISELAINNLETDLAAFAAKKAKYTALFVTGLRGLRTTAMGLPDEETRNATHQTLKGLLPGLAEPCKDNFNDLKGYIRDGWPNENPTPRYEAAGLIKYNNIGANNWENVVGMNESMTQFIADNTAILTAPGGMPGTFAAKVTTDATAFGDTYSDYKTSRETGTARAAKIKANNNLYDAVVEFQKDGVEMVFRKDEANQKRYIFSALKDIVSPPGSASLKVTIKNALDILIPDKTVTIKKIGSAPIMSRTNAEGVALFASVDAGAYEGEVDNNGVPVRFTKDVNTGVDARVVVKFE
ncbi:MAG: hypothetical protein ACHQNT_12885 [Bacteroidia bacterium]